jgi:hypothetical protein
MCDYYDSNVKEHCRVLESHVKELQGRIVVTTTNLHVCSGVACISLVKSAMSSLLMPKQDTILSLRASQ